MANIIRRKEPGELARGWGWDPFGRMRDLLAWDPFSPLETFLPADTFSPRIEVKETSNALVFYADLPGVSADDVDISLTGNRLTISGKREEEQRDEGDRYYTYERTYGSFSRSFTLPESVDTANVKAEFDNGVLRLIVPKRPEVQAKRIPIAATHEPARQLETQKSGGQQQAGSKKAA